MTRKIPLTKLGRQRLPLYGERLIIPKQLRPIILRSLHYGLPGRDSMLATVANVWWPRLHREVIVFAQICPECKEAGKNLKPLLRQSQIGKLPKRKEVDEEIAIDFAGPFQNAMGAKKIIASFNRSLQRVA